MTEDLTPAAIPPSERAALALKSTKTEIELRALAASSADIVSVIDKDGREQAHRIAMTLRGRRVDLEKAGKAARDDATKFSKAVIAEESRLVAIIEPEESRVLGLRDAWDAEQQRIEAARIAAERARMEAHEAAIAAIVRIPADMAGKSADDILACRSNLYATPIGEAWEEYRERAVLATAGAVAQLDEMHGAAEKREEVARIEAAAREAERQRVEVEKAELARQKAEQDAIAARLAAQQKELDDAKAAQEAAAAKARADEDARQQAIAAENKRQADELAAQREAFAAEQRAAQQAKDDAARLEVEQAVAAENARASTYNDGAVDEAVVGLPFEPPVRDNIESAMVDAIATGTGMYRAPSPELPPGYVRVPGYERYAPEDDRKISLGQLSAKFAINGEELKLSAGFLAALGFVATTERASKLYLVRDIPAICAAIIRHVEAVAKEAV